MIEGLLTGAGIMAAGVIIGALIVATTAEYIWGDCDNASEKDNDNEASGD